MVPASVSAWCRQTSSGKNACAMKILHLLIADLRLDPKQKKADFGPCPASPPRPRCSPPRSCPSVGGDVLEKAGLHLRASWGCAVGYLRAGRASPREGREKREPGREKRGHIRPPLNPTIHSPQPTPEPQPPAAIINRGRAASSWGSGLGFWGAYGGIRGRPDALC